MGRGKATTTTISSDAMATNDTRPDFRNSHIDRGNVGYGHYGAVGSSRLPVQATNGIPKINLAPLIRGQDVFAIESDKMRLWAHMTKYIRSLGESVKTVVVKPNEHRKVMQEMDEVTRLFKELNKKDVAITITKAINGSSSDR